MSTIGLVNANNTFYFYFTFTFTAIRLTPGTLTKISAPKKIKIPRHFPFSLLPCRACISIQQNANCFSSHPTFTAACHLPPRGLLLRLPLILLAPPRYDPLLPPLSLLAALLPLLPPCATSAAAANGASCSFSFCCRICHSGFHIYSLTLAPYHLNHFS